MKIKKIDLYMIYSFLFYFVGIFFLIFIVFLIQFFWSQMEELSKNNIKISFLMKFVFYFGITIIPLAIPVSILFTSIMTFGELSENRELLAMKSSGISLFRIMLPILYVVIILSIGLYIFSNSIIPKSEEKIKELGYEFMFYNSPEKLRQGVIENIFPNFFIKVEKKIKKNNYKNVFIFFHNENNLCTNIIISDECIFLIDKKKQNFQLQLFNGSIYNEKISIEKNKKINYSIITFNTLIQNIDIPILNLNKDKYIFNQELKTYTTKEIIRKINFLKNINNDKNTDIIKMINKLQIELHKKFSFPILCIIMFFIGAPFGAIIKKGGIGYSAIISLIIFMSYYTLYTIMLNKVEKLEINPCIGMWIPNFLFFPISIWITYNSVIDKLKII